MRGKLAILRQCFRDMPHDFAGLRVIQMEVEEVNQSPNVTTPLPSSTKELSSKSTTCVQLQGTAGVAESNMTDNRRESNWGSDWVDDGS